MGVILDLALGGFSVGACCAPRKTKTLWALISEGPMLQTLNPKPNSEGPRRMKMATRSSSQDVQSLKHPYLRAHGA